MPAEGSFGMLFMVDLVVESHIVSKVAPEGKTEEVTLWIQGPTFAPGGNYSKRPSLNLVDKCRNKTVRAEVEVDRSGLSVKWARGKRGTR